MRRDGSTREYKFGPKNNWRRTVWNDVLRRTAGREKTEAILYLAGPSDLDRPVAVSKGVPERNLIAIDLSIDNVLNVRSASHYAICADAFKVLRAWPKKVPVCALVLDFCSGLMPGARPLELSQLSMFSQPLSDAVLAVNMMRGRDPGANILTKYAQGFHDCLARLSGNHSGIASIDKKHRGFAFLFCHAVMGCVDQEAVLSGDMTEVLSNLRLLNPRFMSYRSGTLVFDSVVMDPLSRRFQRDFLGVLGEVLREKYPQDQCVVRAIAATLATRTRQAVQ